MATWKPQKREFKESKSAMENATKLSHHWAPCCFATLAIPQRLQRDLHLLSLFNKSFTSYFWLRRALTALTESSYKNKPPVWGNLVAGFSLFEADRAVTVLHSDAGSIFPVPAVRAYGKLYQQQQVLLDPAAAAGKWLGMGEGLGHQVWGWLLNRPACWVAVSSLFSPELLAVSQ